MEGSALSTQEFISIVSHDLRAPVRHLSQFSKILAESVEDPSAEQKNYLASIMASAERCNQMLEGLSRLSKIHHLPSEPCLCDLKALAEEAFQQLSKSYYCDAVLHQDIQLAVPLVIDPGHARYLLEPFIDNAFKFRHPERPLIIRVIASCSSTHFDISIEDNGLGIEPIFIDQCTEIFKQAHGRTPGVGMGLTLAKEVISAQNGELLIENKPLDGGDQHSGNQNADSQSSGSQSSDSQCSDSQCTGTQGAGTKVSIRLPLSTSSRCLQL